jgi:hypothetical protein
MREASISERSWGVAVARDGSIGPLVKGPSPIEPAANYIDRGPQNSGASQFELVSR